MRSFFTAIKTIGSGILVLVVCTVLMLMIFAAPLELAIQSYDLLQMQSTAEGKITRSEVVSNGELSRSIVEYKFSVGNENFESSRVSSQCFFANSYTSDGHLDSESFQLGQKVAVHFDADDPSHCALVYGWSKVPIGWAFLCGALMLGVTKGWVRLVLGALVGYGFCLLAFWQGFVLVHELHYHFLALLFSGAVFWFCPGLFKPTKQSQ